MDYYNFNPDIAGFLSPSIRRKSRENYRRFCPNYSCFEEERFRRDAFINQQYYRTSSTSLVLKKTWDKEIIENYCNDNVRYRPYPDPKLTKRTQSPKHRPLIRVTVIPNTHTSTQAKLRKHRPTPKKIQSTVSNHESFLTAKNIYLVVAGNKREKVYEVKTTGSEHSNAGRYAKDDDIPVEQNFQQLLTSLNMDKKKKKDKGKGKKEKDKKKEVDMRIEEKTSELSMLNMTAGSDSPKMSMLRECICSPPIESVSPRKSRVRITGKIGLTEDDRYVLKCAATVDGEPVDTSYFQEQNRSPPIEQETVNMRAVPKICVTCPGDRVMYCQREPNVAQRDEIIQTNLELEDRFRQTYPCPAFMTPCPAFRSVETQCSPHNNVNTVCFANIEKLKIFSSRDEVIQCECPQDVIVNSKQIGPAADYDNTGNTAKSCNSPLVIISVYPKQNQEEMNNDETSSNENNYRAPAKEKGKKKGGKKDNNDGKKESRAASPTRSKSPTKGKAEVKSEKTKDKGAKGKEKGAKGKEKDDAGKGKNKGIAGGKEPKEGKNKAKTEKSTHNEESPRSKSPERRQSGPQFGISIGRCNECCMGCSGSKKGEELRHISQVHTKRIMNWVSAKKDVSNVAINIDGENEFYDVLYQQDNDTTDVQVRKTVKSVTPTKTGIDVDGGSLENFFLVNNGLNHRKRSFSQTLIIDRGLAENTKDMDTSVPRLNVRDSIEISHRREEKNSNSVTVTSSASSNTTYTSKTKLEHVKHFQGDSCDLSNPVARDKEIRELLGVEKPKRDRPQTYEEFAAKADCRCSLHCFYQRKVSVNAVHNIQELQRLCVEDAHTQATDDDDVEYLDEEFDSESPKENKNVHKKESLAEYTSSKHHDSVPETKMPKKILGGVKKICSCSLHHNAKQQDAQKMYFKQNPCHSKLFPIKVNCSAPAKKSSGFVQSCPKYNASYFPPISSFDLLKPMHISDKTPDIKCQKIDSNKNKTQKVNKLKKNSKKDENNSKPVCAQVTKATQQCVEQKTQFTNYCPDTCFPADNIQKLAESPPICNQLILNRNINIFLQIEQITKQKPIVLSRKQYDKVKRTIECATTKKNNFICKVQSKMLTVGEIKKKPIIPTNNQKYPHPCEVVEQKMCQDQPISKPSRPVTTDKNSSPKVCGAGKCEACLHLYPGESGQINIQSSKPKSSKCTATTKMKCPDIKQSKDKKKVQQPVKNNNSKVCEEKTEQEKRKKSNKSKRRHGAGDENFDQKESFRKQDSCKPTEMKPLDFGSPTASGFWRTTVPIVDSKIKNSVIRQNQATPKPVMVLPEVSYYDNKDEFASCKPLEMLGSGSDAQRCCKRCGRLKQKLCCDNCRRQNKKCVHTCNCYNFELKDDSADSSVKRYKVNDFINKRYAASSTEIRYTNVLFANCTKHVTFSSTNVRNIADKNVPVSVTNLLAKNFDSNSLRTIFKGRRKAPSPNLGTSEYSLYSEYSGNVRSIAKGAQEKPAQERKPFLRRLMSCLVMRSKTSQVKVAQFKSRRRQPSFETSVDSYHINTSLGAADLTSSIYDTSASFYSNHSIPPINKQIIRKGFLSSVREFLTNRKT